MSVGQVQYQQQLPPPQQLHPLLAAVSGNNYATRTSRAHYQHQHRGVRPHRPPLVAAANSHGVYTTGSAAHSGYGYEPSQGYEYHAPASGHLVPPTGGSYSHHTTAGTGYGAPPPPPPLPYPASHPYPHALPQPTPPSDGGAKQKKKGGSGGSSSATTVSALTLLAFFFFVNMLQGCLKEQMAAMNPTVMVLTASATRNRFNKLAEMNSRERGASAQHAAAAPFTSGANIVVQPGDLVASAASAAAAVAAAPTVTLQSPYSVASGGHSPSRRPAATHYDFTSTSTSTANHNNNNNNNNHNNYNYNGKWQGNGNKNENEAGVALTSANHNLRDPRPEFYDSTHTYPNRTQLTSAAVAPTPSTPDQHHYGDDHDISDGHDHDHERDRDHYQPEYGAQHHHHHHHQHNQRPIQDQQQQQTRPSHHSPNAYPWSYGAASSSESSYKRGGSSTSGSTSAAWSSASLPAHATGNNYFDAERYDDSYYTRIN